MAQDEMSVFEKLHDAAQMNRGVHLTFAEVEQEYEKWKAIFEEYQRNYTIEQAQSSDATNE